VVAVKPFFAAADPTEQARDILSRLIDPA